MNDQARRLPTLFLLLLLLVVAGCDPAEDSPVPGSTDIFVTSLLAAGSLLSVGDPVRLTDRQDYDNQPMFLPHGGSLLYTARMGAQTDIFRYDLESNRLTHVTHTLESEYSPTPIPDSDQFSVVRVEQDDKQRLWRFSEDGEPVSPVWDWGRELTVGYHAWSGPDTLVLFILGEPATLRIADVATGDSWEVAESIGRSLNPIPGRRSVSFVHKVSPEEWWVAELEVENREIRRLVRTRPGAEDHAWSPSGVLLMAQETRLYAWTAGSDWLEVGDFAEHGVRRITRLAVSPQGDRLAFVAER